jgi:hypothetical protein
MNKQTIIEQLDIHYAEFTHLLSSLDEADYCFAPQRKWSAGQQLDHICRSVAPVNMAFGLPGFVLRLLFGKANRPSLSYEDLVKKYQAKLAAGGRASKPFIPEKAEWEKREKLLHRLGFLIAGLRRKVEKTTENQLDTCILPHPLLGKITLREMLYFTIYHVQHHQNLVLGNLELRSGG